MEISRFTVVQSQKLLGSKTDFLIRFIIPVHTLEWMIKRLIDTFRTVNFFYFRWWFTHASFCDWGSQVGILRRRNPSEICNAKHNTTEDSRKLTFFLHHFTLTTWENMGWILCAVNTTLYMHLISILLSMNLYLKLN